MLFKNFRKIKTAFPPCEPGQVEKVTAVADLEEDISPAFPYLNAIFKGTIYNPKAQTLNFKLGGRGITLYPRRILVTKLKNKEEAEKVLKRLKDIINRTYEKKDQIEPSYKTRAKLTVLDLYRLLPKTNCRECGEATCMAFATKLVTEEVTIDKCKPVFTSTHKDTKEKLFDLLDEAGYALPTK